MEDEMFNALMDSIKDIDNVDGLILAACKTLARDKKMSEVIFSEIDASSVLFKTLASFRNRELPTTKNGEPNKQNLLVDKAYLFGEKGTIAIIQDWVLGGFKEPAELIAEIISFLVQNINESIKSYGK
ncbi:TetR-like C-terminal domain-containing protein [Pedobacter rhodius]|uniref:TetR-like C-terminal domain-containing protein n=1 Tax=Pedobacter rhodius TaxID=3004098 RepID=A0ABT4KZS9_9SPHI|nr:TetR-like C-terminal domain-containing protein [Pedobacter sp. SJ11]MCZ4224441.1 TetR-like C-terminal domain-containing protein [Pedobacter sp. SJ11]